MRRVCGRRALRAIGSLCVMSGGVASCRPAEPAASLDTALPAATTEVSVARPTVIAYFIVPPGAVDTSRDLAVEADDWNVAMAALRDSLEATGIALAMVTEPNVRVRLPRSSDTTLTLGAPGAAGYVLVRPDRGLCLRPGGADADSVKAIARAFAASHSSGCT